MDRGQPSRVVKRIRLPIRAAVNRYWPCHARYKNAIRRVTRRRPACGTIQNPSVVVVPSVVPFSSIPRDFAIVSARCSMIPYLKKSLGLSRDLISLKYTRHACWTSVNHAVFSGLSNSCPSYLAFLFLRIKSAILNKIINSDIHAIYENPTMKI